jgi:hypothetical protein
MQTMINQGDPGVARFTDPTGLVNLFAGMLRAGKQSNPAFHGGLVIGMSDIDRVGLNTFVWQGVRWDAPMLLGRLLWLGLGVILTCLGALPFDRFDPSLERNRKLKKGKKANTQRDDALESGISLQPEIIPVAPSLQARSSVANLHPARQDTGPGAWIGLLIANLRLMLKGLPWWWYAVLVGLLAGCLVAPLEVSRSTLLPLIWIWPVLIWSPLGCRENTHRTAYFLFSAPAPLVGQTLAAWGAGVLLAIVTGSGAAIRILVSGQPNLLLPWIIGALFIPSLALAVGSWTGSSKAFEVIYVILWYLGPMNHVPGLDFIGTTTTASPVFLFFACALAFLGLGLTGRWRQLREV